MTEKGSGLADTALITGATLSIQKVTDQGLSLLPAQSVARTETSYRPSAGKFPEAKGKAQDVVQTAGFQVGVETHGAPVAYQ